MAMGLPGASGSGGKGPTRGSSACMTHAMWAMASRFIALLRRCGRNFFSDFSHSGRIPMSDVNDTTL
eukprot:7002722-Prymnesium_polylepis.2